MKREQALAVLARAKPLLRLGVQFFLEDALGCPVDPGRERGGRRRGGGAKTAALTPVNDRGSGGI
jgi:hypothetical protein